MTVITPTDTMSAKQALAEALNRSIDEMDEEQLLTDLVAESFALIEAVIRIQESLGIRLAQADLREVKTVGDLLGVCTSRARAPLSPAPP